MIPQVMQTETPMQFYSTASSEKRSEQSNDLSDSSILKSPFFYYPFFTFPYG